MASVPTSRKRRAYIAGIDKQTPAEGTKRRLVQGRPKRFHFLKLAPEIQYFIYEACAAMVETVYVSGKSNPCATSKHPLHFICRKTHREFGSVLSKDAPVTATNIVAHVIDFDFRAAIRYLNRVASNIEAGPPLAPLGERSAATYKVTLVFTVTSSWNRNPNPEAILQFSRTWSKLHGHHFELKARIHDVEDKASTSRLINDIAGWNLDDSHSKWWSTLLPSFNNYFAYGSGDQKKAKARMNKKLRRLDDALAAARVDEMDVDYRELWGDFKKQRPQRDRSAD